MTRLRAPLAVALALLLAYAVTLAPGVTFWDSGEFLAAIRSLGIPHPPGTPLYILLGNVWAQALAPVLGFALSVNLFSAVCTAAACGLLAVLMIRWTGDVASATAGALLAGLMSSVWLNANETEVYGPALLMAMLILVTADNARRSGEARWLLLLAYLSGLAWTLQLSALVVLPGALALLVGATHDGRWTRMSLASLALAALGASAVFFLLVRAQHDPAVNQGNTASWRAFIDVLTRAQYVPAPLFPRQAPLFIQIGNVFEYADWQIARGLAPEPPPAWVRTPFTIAYALLGVVGALWHRRVHRPSWRAMVALLATATFGVVLYLNMKAGPSFGYGFLPDDAPREARERDYFFFLAWVTWGVWAGSGAVRLLSRFGKPGIAGAFAVAALPFALNFAEVDRSAAPMGSAARDSAMAILDAAPPRAVVLAYGDNDTYPVWYAQVVEGIRPDVTVVTIPLFGAGWYREELLRRYSLSTEPEGIWQGHAEAIAAICSSAAALGRPVMRGGGEVPRLGLDAGSTSCP